MTNRLAEASSAYLRSAAHQPIHWYPWSDAAFAAAQAADRPVLLDIGAVWCHWCHVMDGESYEDPAIATFLNDNFVCIKVDRDERPDVDVRYQRAVQAMSGQGGWPLTGFLTPTGQVFYGGTYFPPDGKYGRPGFRSVLDQVLNVFRTQRDRVEQQAGTVRRILSEQLDEGAAGALSPALLATAAEQMALRFDFQNGGFGGAPKFPHPGAVRFLLERAQDTGNADHRAMAEQTLLAMARGGMHDQIGGGFHRYSVDARWIVPHFEKMAYDNAELLRAYVEGAIAFGEAEYLTVAAGIVRWIREVLADPEGGYGASQDADVGLHDDGDYFTWTAEEAAGVLTPEEFAVASAHYDIGTAGDMHHDPSRNVLFIAESVEAISQRLGLDLATTDRRLEDARRKLLAARELREAPFVDRSRYTSWNAMLIGALLRAAPLLNDPWPLEHALRTLHRIRREQPDPNALMHAPNGGGGLLEDQVQFALALIEAYEATGDLQWLSWCETLLDRTWELYEDGAAGGLFDTSGGASATGLLSARVKPVQDTPTPSPNGVAALVAARLAELTGAARWRERRDRQLQAFAAGAPELGIFGAAYLLAASWALLPASHVVIIEDGDTALANALHIAALQCGPPRRVVQRVRAGDDALLPAAVRGMLGAARGTRAYLCVGASCRPPVQSVEAWRGMLGEVGGAVGG
ncbi:MAG: thioredoxin domain-containing protein [Gemmatimonadota bacterium]|nr:thioredoxin domain-containing protein [Gemmatimonadota bacterium]